MNSRILTVTLALAICLVLVIFLGSYGANYRLPGNNQGYEPVQPIAYSHRLHAGELQIPCLHCHSGAEKSRTAGIPPANVCMNCHRFVTAPFMDVRAEDELAAKEKRKPRAIVSPELGKLYRAMALDAGDGMKPDPARTPVPIAWNRIHVLPAFAYFSHSAHVSAGVTCQNCHGPVETMERVRQVSDLSMGWCVNCHRDVNQNGVAGRSVHASTDCSTCHF